jgi:hypothetical protein
MTSAAARAEGIASLTPAMYSALIDLLNRNHRELLSGLAKIQQLQSSNMALLEKTMEQVVAHTLYWQKTLQTEGSLEVCPDCGRTSFSAIALASQVGQQSSDCIQAGLNRHIEAATGMFRNKASSSDASDNHVILPGQISQLPPPAQLPVVSRTQEETLPYTKLSRTTQTVTELWTEWMVDLPGKPSIARMNAEYGGPGKWLDSPSEMRFYRRRKPIIEAIQMHLSYTGSNPQAAVQEIESQRNGQSLYAFGEQLRKQIRTSMKEQV